MPIDEKEFSRLLDRYLTDQASADEVSELMRQIKSGAYDQLLKERIGHSVQFNPADRDISLESANHLLNKILSSEKNTAQLIPMTKPRITYWPWLSAAAVVLVLVGWWLMARRSDPSPVKQGPAIARAAEQAVDNGKGRFVRFPDGSTVLLHSGSTVEYAADFSTTREVTLRGEGYFDIRHDNQTPFIVHTGEVNTTVLGTAFNIQAWQHQREIVVTVTQGKVRVSDRKKILGELTANQQLAVNTDTRDFTHQNVNAEPVLAWKKDYLILENSTLEEAAQLIGDKYHKQVILSNPGLRQYRISATFLSHENIEQVLNVVCGVVGATYTLLPNDQIMIK